MAQRTAWERDYDVMDSDDVADIAPDVGSCRSRDVSVIPGPDSAEANLSPAGLPPIHAYGPVHTLSRRLVLPCFSHERVARSEPHTRELCRRLLDEFSDPGHADAAAFGAEAVR